MTFFLDANGFQRAVHGSGSAAIYLNNVVCAGNESRLLDCAVNANEYHICLHLNDAGVTCLVAGKNQEVLNKGHN